MSHEATSETLNGELWLKLSEAERSNESQAGLLHSAVKLALEQEDELRRWRSGGVTEELLRRGDGFVKVGIGCVIVRQADYDELRDIVQKVSRLNVESIILQDLVDRAKLIQ